MPLRRARPDLREAWVDYHPGLPGLISEILIYGILIWSGIRYRGLAGD